MIKENFNPYDLNHVAVLNYGTPEEFKQRFQQRTQPPVVNASNRGLLKMTEEELSQPKPQRPQT